MPPHTVLIVGCGIAGPTLALTILHHPQLRTQYTPILLDRLPAASASSAGAAVVLSSNALHPLVQLGLHDAVWAASEEAISTTMWRSATDPSTPGRCLNALHNPNWNLDIGSGLRVVERAALMKLLVDAVAARGGEVLWDAKVTAVAQTPTGVDVLLEDGRRRYCCWRRRRVQSSPPPSGRCRRRLEARVHGRVGGVRDLAAAGGNR